MKFILEFWMLCKVLNTFMQMHRGIWDNLTSKNINKGPFSEVNLNWTRVMLKSSFLPKVCQGPFLQSRPVADGILNYAGLVWTHPLSIKLQRGWRPIQIRHRLRPPQLCPGKREAVLPRVPSEAPYVRALSGFKPQTTGGHWQRAEALRLPKSLR